MSEIGIFFAGIHNWRIADEIEDRLNSFIEAVNAAGGKCWLQSKTNKEHCYELTEPVHFNYYEPVNIPDDAAFTVHINDVGGIVKGSSE